VSARLSTLILLVLTIVSVTLGSRAGSSSSHSIPVSTQETTEKEGERERHKPASSQAVRRAIEGLRQAVNGRSAVRNRCQAHEREVEVEESSEILEATGCSIIVKTVKKAGPESEVLSFTLRANLLDLTTPASVEPLHLANCRPEAGTLVQLVSRAKPGKSIRTTRVASGTQPAANQPVPEGEAPARRSLTFFFPNAELAQKAAKALNRAVAVCGGEEWPDEDDLP